MKPTGMMLDLGGGRLCDPLDPFGFAWRIQDIAGPLSRICRWGGRCRPFYSVAQHSVYVADQVAAADPGVALHALLHDAAEAVLGDVPTPLKRCLQVRVGAAEPWPFDTVEAMVLESIHLSLGLRALEAHEHSLIAHADQVALRTEARDLMGNPEWARARGACDMRRLAPKGPVAAEAMFLDAFERYSGAEVGR